MQSETYDALHMTPMCGTGSCERSADLTFYFLSSFSVYHGYYLPCQHAIFSAIHGFDLPCQHATFQCYLWILLTMPACHFSMLFVDLTYHASMPRSNVIRGFY